MLTDQQHPITPPSELIRKWNIEAGTAPMSDQRYIAIQAARWGADQELEACCEWLSVPCPSYGRELRAARRPKPPSLAEQALAALNEIEDRYAGPSTEEILVRRALERLQELENNDN